MAENGERREEGVVYMGINFYSNKLLWGVFVFVSVFVFVFVQRHAKRKRQMERRPRETGRCYDKWSSRHKVGARAAEGRRSRLVPRRKARTQITGGGDIGDKANRVGEGGGDVLTVGCDGRTVR